MATTNQEEEAVLKIIESKATNEDEAADCAKRAHELLSKMNMKAQDRDYGHYAQADYYEESWVVQVWIAVSRYFFCTYIKGRRPVESRRGGRARQACVHTVIGAKQNVMATKTVATYLVETARRLAKEATDKEKKRRPQRDMRPFENKYKRGAGLALAERVLSLRDEAASTDERLSKIYAREDANGDRYLNEVFGGQKKHPAVAGDGFIEGQKAGDAVLLKTK